MTAAPAHPSGRDVGAGALDSSPHESRGEAMGAAWPVALLQEEGGHGSIGAYVSGRARVHAGSAEDRVLCVFALIASYSRRSEELQCASISAAG
ncbi:unnamed protein product [Lampetra fluviatilis]